ncbi:hypothetical protein [Streptomyces europaeiscabiei]|uniref:hypothetical protein n=1 Tax=Streptomyces europaeiscabiei TaxID=146819 RepID=UPI0038F69B8B
MLLVEQNLPPAMRVTHRVTVMVRGRMALTGPPDGFLDDEQVRELLGVGAGNRAGKQKGPFRVTPMTLPTE